MNRTVGEIRLNLQFDHPVTAFALVIGGWFPLSLAFSSVLLVDRNILGILEVAQGARSRPDSEANAWWLQYLNREGCRLNPILCAMEGNQRTHPTQEQLVDEYNRAADDIRRYLPQATVVELSEAALNAAYCALCETKNSYNKISGFLGSVVPLLVNRVGASRLRDVERQIFRFSYHHELAIFSLPVICALSCLYEPRDGREPMIGRNIIKPSQCYTDQDAHNAIWDIRSLEYLAQVNCVESLALCTRDRYMVALWCALKARTEHAAGSVATVAISLGETLFPRLSIEECNELYGRMQEFAANNIVR